MKKHLSRREALKRIGLTTVGGALAACTPGSSNATPAATDPTATTAAASPAEMQEIEIKVSLWDIANSFPAGEPDAMHKFVADKFKIKFTPVNVGWGDADDRYNTWAASGQLPDIIGAVAMPGTARYFQWINDGVVRPLPDDVSAYPEIARLVSQPEVTDFAVGGKNYFLPRPVYADASWWAMDRGLIVRKDWMEKLGIPEPKTEEDYINMAVAFAKQDPDGNGRADTAGYTPIGVGFLWSQTWTGFGYTDDRWMKDDDGKYRMALSSPETFRLFQFLKKMYKAGGLDPDFATLESNQALEKFAAGKTGMLGRQVSPKHLKAVMDAWVKVQPDKDFVESIQILHGPTLDGSYTRYGQASYWSESYFSAQVNDEKMDRILQLYNWLYSEEGMYMLQYGFEGQDYTIENGNVKLLTPVDPATGLHKSTAELYPFSYAMGYLAAWTSDLLQYEDPSIPQSIRDLTEAERDFRIQNWKAPEINWAVQSIDVPEKQEMAAVTFGDDWARFIMDTSNKSDEALFEEMKKNWDANGYAAAVEAITAKAQELGIE